MQKMLSIAVLSLLTLTFAWGPSAFAQLAPAPFPGFNPNAGIDRTAPPVLAAVAPNVASGQQRIFLNGFNFTAFNTVVFSGPTVATAGASSAVGNSAVTFIPAHLPPGTYIVILVDAYGRPSNPAQLQITPSFSPSSLLGFPALSGQAIPPQQQVLQRSAVSRPVQNSSSQNPLLPFPLPNSSGGFPSNASYPPWVYGINGGGLQSNALYPPWVYGAYGGGLPSNALYPPWVYGVTR